MGEMVAATVAVMAVVATEEVTAEEVAKVEVAVVRVAGAKEEVERAMAVVAWRAEVGGEARVAEARVDGEVPEAWEGGLWSSPSTCLL